MFKELEEISSRPAPFQFYTAKELWTNEHTSKKMLEYHLNESLDMSSRNKDFIDRSLKWIVSYFGIDANTIVADFGCGPGLYTTRLAEKNANELREEVSTYEYMQLNGFWSSENYYGFLNTFKYDEDKVILDKYTIIEEAQTQTVYNWLQYFSPGSLRKKFEESGFNIEEYYSDVAGTVFSPESVEFAIIAKKS